METLTFLLFSENHSAPPDVTTYTSKHSIQVERPQGSTSRAAPKYGNAELMETGDGMSSKREEGRHRLQKRKFGQIDSVAEVFLFIYMYRKRELINWCLKSFN